MSSKVPANKNKSAVVSPRSYTREVTVRFLEAVDEIIGVKSAGKETQMEFAEKIGIKASNLNRMRYYSENNVTIHALCALVDYYNYSPTWLLTGIGEKIISDKKLKSKGPDLENAINQMSSALAVIKKFAK